MIDLQDCLSLQNLVVALSSWKASEKQNTNHLKLVFVHIIPEYTAITELWSKELGFQKPL